MMKCSAPATLWAAVLEFRIIRYWHRLFRCIVGATCSISSPPPARYLFTWASAGSLTIAPFIYDAAARDISTATSYVCCHRRKKPRHCFTRRLPGRLAYGQLYLLREAAAKQHGWWWKKYFDTPRAISADTFYQLRQCKCRRWWYDIILFLTHTGCYAHLQLRGLYCYRPL